jgi:steroid delta-isomerase-like uncharacterized protein
MAQNSLHVVQRYFDAWNQHDSAAVVAAFAEGGTYTDPATPGPLTGAAIGSYAEALWASFPDLSFEISSVMQNGSGLVSAEWRMKGTNTGSFNGLPPTGIAIELPGADFIRVEGEKIRSVQGYFDSAAVPRALGLDVIIQPKAIGPFSFGVSLRASNGNTATPGAFSITWIDARTDEEKLEVGESGRRIVTEMLSMPGFIGWVSAAVGNRKMTITAWESPEAAAQLMKSTEHRSAVERVMEGGLGGGGITGVWVPAWLNRRLVRCPSCGGMMDGEKAQGKCACGAALPDLPAYW